jgi:uncharacterized protein (TIGR00288 family)
MNIGIFIDGENISAKEYERILDDICRYGQISISNIYLDWSQNTSWLDVSKKFGITPIQCHKINKKNSVDLKLSVDVMETLYERQIDLFCILTTDSDFCHIVQKLKSKNKMVYIYGYGEIVNQSLLSVCHQFINIKSLRTDLKKLEIEEMENYSRKYRKKKYKS